jgi:hypothetical protein
MKKIILDNVTLATVSSVRIQDTVDALLYNLRGIGFRSVKLISHQRPASLPAHVEFCRCSRLDSLERYSRFMLYELCDYIDTEFCLTIQRDGVIVHPSRWTSDFLHYDYIGAPWPIDDAFCDPFGRYVRVGNGGFSLRSKRLLAAGRECGIPFAAANGCLHEDVLLCVRHGRQLEDAGIRFAPLDVACRFAHEMRIPEIKNILPFGFHKYRKQNRFYPRFPSKWRACVRQIAQRLGYARPI